MGQRTKQLLKNQTKTQNKNNNKMKLNHLYGCLLSLISGATLLATTCAAQDLAYVGTKAQAIARAKDEGKMILTKFGRVSCSDCSGMESRFQGMAPPLKQWILSA